MFYISLLNMSFCRGTRIMKISVAMCTYNGGKYLREQLNSVASGALLPDELVICDDRSSDSTADIVSEFASSSKFLVRFFINEKNLGSTKNFEKAIGLCTGDIIVLSDQDDVWYPEKLSVIKETFTAHPEAGLVFTDADMVDEELKPLGYGLWSTIEFDNKEQASLNGGNAMQVLLRHNVVTGATAAFRASYRDIVLPVPAGWVHDGWIALVISAVSGLYAVDRRLIGYRQHSSQQIGAQKSADVRAKMIDKAFKADDKKKDIKEALVNFEAARARLSRAKNFNMNSGVIGLLDAKVAHLKARIEMPSFKPARIPGALRELAAMRYHKYSIGFYSFIKDLTL